MIKQVKKLISILLVCTFCGLLLTGCGGSGGNSSPQSQKDAVLALLNNVRSSNGVNILSEDSEADSVAARIANAGIDYEKGNITESQFDAEFRSAYRTKVHGGYCTAMYTANIIPTRASHLSGEEVTYKSGRIVGIAIREYKNTVLTIIVVY